MTARPSGPLSEFATAPYMSRGRGGLALSARWAQGLKGRERLGEQGDRAAAAVRRATGSLTEPLSGPVRLGEPCHRARQAQGLTGAQGLAQGLRATDRRAQGLGCGPCVRF